MTFGLSGVVPAVHHAVADGWFNAISKASLGWLILMGCLYILGALFYALRVPERFFPGKCDYVVSLLVGKINLTCLFGCQNLVDCRFEFKYEIYSVLSSSIFDLMKIKKGCGFLPKLSHNIRFIQLVLFFCSSRATKFSTCSSWRLPLCTSTAFRKWLCTA